jgi:hypothetical protein
MTRLFFVLSIRISWPADRTAMGFFGRRVRHHFRAWLHHRDPSNRIRGRDLFGHCRPDNRLLPDRLRLAFTVWCSPFGVRASHKPLTTSHSSTLSVPQRPCVMPVFLFGCGFAAS